MPSSTWSTSSRADSSSPASKRCAAASPCNSALSFRPFISPTTSASSRANTSSPCAASKSLVGTCSKTGYSPSVRNSLRPRLLESPPASPLSASPHSGFPAPSSRRPLPPAMPSSIRLPCSPRTSPKSSVSTPTSCLLARKPSACSIASVKASPSSSKNSFPKS